MGMLEIGAGAGKGLEQLLARMLEEEKFEEAKRSNRADEGLRAQQIAESGAIRRENQQFMNQERLRQDQDRNENRIARTVAFRPIGAEVTPQEMERETRAGVPTALYKEQPPQLASRAIGPGGITQNQSKPGVIEFQGTQSAQAAEQRITDAERRARAAEVDRDQSRALAQQRESRIAGWGPPLVMIADPNVPGGARMVGRPDAAGQPAPAPAAQRQKLDAYNLTISMIEDLLKEHPPTSPEWEAGLGPIDSTIGAGVRQYTGMEIPGLSGGGEKGERLRTNLNRLRAQASFQEGGKQFTGTEARLLESFLATVDKQPKVALERLNEFLRAAKMTRDQLSGAGTVPGAGDKDPLGLGF